MKPEERYKRELEELRAAHLFRRPMAIDSPSGPVIESGGRSLVNLSSNDYLGFSTHHCLKQVAISALSDWGTGSGSARLVAGDLPVHRDLERAIAIFFAKEDAVLFNSGFQANAGLYSALTDEGDVIFSDQLCHASIVDGCRLAPARKVIVPHADARALAKRIEETPCRGMRLFVTDGLFSVDGDRAPLARQLEVAQQYDCMVVVDDAHAVGVLGENGRGGAEEAGCLEKIDVVVGTFSKALGSFGAFVACSGPIADILRNRSRSYIYTTSLPPAVAMVNRAALKLVDSMTGREARKRVARLSGILREGLALQGWEMGDSHDHILPLILGPESAALQAEALLKEAGFYVRALRPPTVPAGSSRVRVSLRSDLDDEDLDRFLVQAESLLSLRNM